MRLILSSIVLVAALAANPCFAKDGHAQHGARASAAANGASGKGASGASGANPAPSKADVPIGTETAVAPPVLPPRGVTQQQIRTINPSGKTPANTMNHATMGSTTMPVARNAIAQPFVSPKNFAGAQPPVPAPQKPGAVSPLNIHGTPGTPGASGGPAAPAVVSSGIARLNAANATNRGTINGATVIRPASSPSVIGGPAQARYGINGTTVQNRH